MRTECSPVVERGMRITPEIPEKQQQAHNEHIQPDVRPNYPEQQVRIGARISTPEQFKTRENFPTFFQHFQHHVTLRHVQDSNQYLLFLNMVDDRTLRKLEEVTAVLSPAEKRNSTLFLPLFIRTINPASEARALHCALSCDRRTTLSAEKDAFKEKIIPCTVWELLNP